MDGRKLITTGQVKDEIHFWTTYLYRKRKNQLSKLDKQKIKNDIEYLKDLLKKMKDGTI